MAPPPLIADEGPAVANMAVNLACGHKRLFKGVLSLRNLQVPKSNTGTACDLASPVSIQKLIYVFHGLVSFVCFKVAAKGKHCFKRN